MGFPITRLRRTRSGEKVRAMVRETRLSAANLVMPLFVCEGEDVDRPISSMPGNSQLSIDRLVRECREIADLGIPAVILFGIPETKDEVGTGAWIDEGIVQRAVRAVKEAVPGLLVITDLCFCEYTSHGHCGVIRDGAVDNDATLENLARAAVSQAAAGADMIAPSDMMDGRIGRIRGALDIAGYTDLPIMAYSAKYASAFYGPFREAAESAPQFGDRRSYQMDPANAREAVREVELDIEEGADIVMVKPALPYLDIIRAVRDRFSVPVAAYNVSGEFSMVMAAAERGWIDADRVSMEILLCIKRAGADIILTYYAKKAARLLTAGPGA